MALVQQGTITADGTTTGIIFKGGQLYLHINGTFGSGTVTVHISYDDGATYIPASVDGTYTSSAIRSIELPDCRVRLVMAGSTSPSITYAMAVRSPV
jgi:hypothetical protein